MTEPSTPRRAQSVTKYDLATRVVERVGFTRKESLAIVEDVFEAMKQCLEQGKPLKVSGFGVFNTKHKEARRGRNPQTGDEIEVSARKVVRFKASEKLKTAMLSSSAAQSGAKGDV